MIPAMIPYVYHEIFPAMVPYVYHEMIPATIPYVHEIIPSFCPLYLYFHDIIPSTPGILFLGLS